MLMLRNMTLHVADHAYKEYHNCLKAEYYTKRQEHERSKPLSGVDGGVRSSRKSSKGALAKVVVENNELRRREEEASKKVAEVKVELEKSKTLQEQIASPGDSHISSRGFNGGLSPGLFSRLLSGSFDGDVLRYLGALGGLAKGFGSQEGLDEGQEHKEVR
ncbi:hypothetical protein D8674_020513 [Pyrus ussuriensis x Pyrus communis]|uniref:Uncharacterized protein n=1 Tax=Pyrus ussuriensis x Pyrus communis TaxID=2448454 RepID=A0A5N5HG98_9ROSA|nr:hypothetical protein D8674_020513 [Pyrus ussuriensis x Pyrus communis]